MDRSETTAAEEWATTEARTAAVPPHARPAPADLTMAAPAPVDPAVVELVARCDAELVAAQLATDPADRFLHAHLGALRLAGALLAAAGARPPRGRPRSAWDRLTAAVPDSASWAAFFTSGARIRAALDAGVDSVDDAFATTWVEAAEDFRDEVCHRVGIDPYADLRSSLSARSLLSARAPLAAGSTMAWAS